MAKTLAELIEARFGLATTDGAAMPAEGTHALQLAHRSHRAWERRPVEDELLRVLLACAFSAPSKSDLQQCSVVVVDDPARRKRITDLVPEMPWMADAARFLVFCGDNRRIRRICEMRGKPFANDHLDSFLNACVDTGLVLQGFITAAEAAGLGCCPISVIRNHAAVVAEALKLPEGVFPVCGLCLGWPARPGYTTLRLPLAVTVHTDAYDDSRLGEEVDAYDRRRDARHSIPPEKQRRRDELGTAAFYGWSEDKARQTSRPERADLGAFVRRQGFTLS